MVGAEQRGAAGPLVQAGLQEGRAAPAPRQKGKEETETRKSGEKGRKGRIFVVFFSVLDLRPLFIQILS